MSGRTIIDKLWDTHVVGDIDGVSKILYIDRHFVHEVTSPQAFESIRRRGRKVLRPEKTVATADHNVPTINQGLEIQDGLSKLQLDTLELNCRENGISFYGLGHKNNGIVHVIGPELGITQPGMTIVCGDSHTATHGAFGALAFGIGTSQVEMVLASQCLVQSRPKRMRIRLEGRMQKGVGAKDLILYVISRMTTAGATGYFVEYDGPVIRSMSMEERMTVCNMSIEMGARGGLVAPDQTTFDYLRDKPYAPKGQDWDMAVERWKSLPTDKDAVFDREEVFDVSSVEPMVTYGTNPGMAVGVSGTIPHEGDIEKSLRTSFKKSLDYMGFKQGEKLHGKKIDYVFLGSCTNGRIEDIRAFAWLVNGRKKAAGVTVWIVPGSKQVEEQAVREGLDRILIRAGMEFRQPGCSACLAMNDDKVPPGKYAVSTTNRNFEGRQGPGSRTILAGPLTAAAAAITGRISDPRELIK